MKKLLFVALVFALVFAPANVEAKRFHSFQATVLEDAVIYDVYNSEYVTVFSGQGVNVAAVVKNEGLQCFIQWRAPLPIAWRAGWMPCDGLVYQ